MRRLRKLFAPALLAALIFPLIMTEAQRNRRRQPRANQQAQATDATQNGSAQSGATDQPRIAGQGGREGRDRRGKAAKAQGQQEGTGSQAQRVVRRVNQARLSAATIKTIRSLSQLRGVVAVRGSTIRPLDGSSLWQLENGSYLLVGGGTVKPSAVTVTHEFPCMTGWTNPPCVFVEACYCKGYDPNKDDGCRFEGTPGAQTCKQSGGVNCSCSYEAKLITSDGSTYDVTTVTGF